MKDVKTLSQLGIGNEHPTYFIAEIGSNFDGSKQRAVDLIGIAKDAGAQAVKFQHYTAKSLVNQHGFENMGGKVSHQQKWDDSVYNVYDNASLPLDWTADLAKFSKREGIDFFSSPYSFDLAENIEPHVDFFKIGSGDITFTALIEFIAKFGKPILLGTGASSIMDVERALSIIESHNVESVVMQCNTNYTGSGVNNKHLNLNVFNTYKKHFPNSVLGLSDHMTEDHIVLASIAMGARVVERHFTDDTTRSGPDHPFSMDPESWKAMILKARELEEMLGNGVKRIEENETDTAIVQRRALCLTKNLEEGSVLKESSLEALRPCPEGAFEPYQIQELVGKTLSTNLSRGSVLTLKNLQD
jgi:N-acetylneuraminate synthase